jgi:hypothetical protein
MVTVRVRNDGTHAWTPIDMVRVGTAAPRDWGSPLAHPAWLSDNRTGTFLENRVDPGGTATFTFPISVPSRTAVTGEFQLVVDGTCWLPNTQFSVTAAATHRSAASRPVRAMIRRMRSRK